MDTTITNKAKIKFCYKHAKAINQKADVHPTYSLSTSPADEMELMKHLGSGVPRILEAYNRDCFIFMDNFILMSFPKSEGSFVKDGGEVISQQANRKRQKNEEKKKK